QMSSKADKLLAKQLVLELFHEVHLPDPKQIYEKYPHEISGGQRQRVMIAMAIASSPELLIADEPTTELDVTVQSEVLKLLKSLREKRGRSLLFITHDLAVVSEIADDVVVMWRGEIVEAGSAEQVLLSPKHPYTQALIACRPTPNSKGKPLITVNDIIDKRSATKIEMGLGSSNVLLQVNSLHKHYRNASGPSITKALNDVSFCINSGETLGLVGESGCGKSTLSRLLMGFIQPDSGGVNYNFSSGDKLILPTEKKNDLKLLRSKVQLVFQDPFSSLNPKMLVRDILLEPIRNYSTKEKGSIDSHISELLERVGLPADSAKKFPHEFSGGQRQRIVIARALACKPELLICDESVAALDVSVQAQVLNLLNTLKTELGLTLLFISHDLNVVYYMSDRIMVMNKGQIEEMGNADQVFYRPESNYTKRLLSSLPVASFKA
ncbi:MAG: dipeptide ABC transporter ATP-binding protein, partial [Flavobacteriales bacterium]